MKIINPLAITDSILTSSSVTEADYTPYSAITAYNLNDYCMVVSSNVHKIYQSLMGSASSAVTMTIASPCVVSWTSHGLSAGTPIYFTTTGALPTGLTVNTVYYVLTPTASTFNLSASVGGSAINTSGTQSGTHTANAGNINKTPANNPTVWLDCGATNRWKMFDGSVQSQTTNSGGIDVVFAAVGRVNSIAILNCVGDSVRIKITDAIDGIVYDKTYSMVATTGIIDLYSYFFNPILNIADLVVTDLPAYLNPTIELILTRASGSAACGGCILGQFVNVGYTQYGATVGIQDYSVKVQDAFGNYTITQRAYRKIASFSVWIDAGEVDALQTLLASYRAVPVVYVGADAYGSTIIYGFYKECSIAISYPTQSVCIFNIEGLT